MCTKAKVQWAEKGHGRATKWHSVEVRKIGQLKRALKTRSVVPKHPHSNLGDDCCFCNIDMAATALAAGFECFWSSTDDFRGFQLYKQVEGKTASCNPTPLRGRRKKKRRVDVKRKNP